MGVEPWTVLLWGNSAIHHVPSVCSIYYVEARCCLCNLLSQTCNVFSQWLWYTQIPSIPQCHYDQRGVCVFGGVGGWVFLPCLVLYTYESPWQQSHRPALSRGAQVKLLEPEGAERLAEPFVCTNLNFAKGDSARTVYFFPDLSISINGVSTGINPLSLFTSKHWREIMLDIIVWLRYAIYFSRPRVSSPFTSQTGAQSSVNLSKLQVP